MAIAEAGLAIMASAAGINDRVAAAGQKDLGPPIVGYIKNATLGS